MKAAWIKYLVLFIAVFAVIERTDIAVKLLTNAANKLEAASQATGDEDNSTDPNELKETSIKECWDIHQLVTLPQLLNIGQPVHYRGEQGDSHLAWVPPVPTPPPNL
jgi:hypothetical protein